MGFGINMISRNVLSEQIATVQSLGDEAVREAMAGADDKMRLIELRRLLATNVDKLITMAESAVTALPAENRNDIHKECRRLVNESRTAVANHLANWPAVNIDQDKAGYAASAMKVAAAYSNFVNWARGDLLTKLSH
jgi:hypothetical protein